jgi:hypothetical protein
MWMDNNQCLAFDERVDEVLLIELYELTASNNVFKARYRLGDSQLA